ncbi:MAG: hypothetical protein QOD92_3150 [Acidimicrobiaceae bacterium]
MKVVFVSWRDLAHPSSGGSEVLVSRLIEQLLARGHSAALVCGRPIAPGRAYPVVSAGGTYSQYLGAPLAVRKVKDADLLVDVSNGIPYFSPLWWRGPKLCLFTHVHGDQWHGQFPKPIAEAGWFFERKVMPWVYRNTQFVTISPSTADALQRLGVDGARIHISYPGIDDELLVEPVAKSKDPLFVILGRLAPNKQVDRVLDAWRRVQCTSGGTLVVIGDGPLRASLEAQDVPGVEFRGRVSDAEKRSLLGAAWLMLHAARHEGWGIGIMEAAAQATPTLAFDVDGVRDSIVPEVTGRLIATQEEFEAAWMALAQDRELLARWGAAARKRAADFTWERSMDEFLVAAKVSLAAVGKR